jgi:hypothetical protein
MPKLEQQQALWQREYATRADFCRIFRNEMKTLYLLAFLLTGNRTKAEQCFLAALADVGNETVVLRQFAAFWSRRAIIVHALRSTAPLFYQDGTSDLWDGSEDESATGVMNRLLQLVPLERFVFVLSVLEGYRDAECATLLCCVPAEVMQARMRALQNLSYASGNQPSAALQTSAEQIFGVASVSQTMLGP